MTYEDWNMDYKDLLIQMYHAVLQNSDLNIEVNYPIDYVANAIPFEYGARDTTLAMTREFLAEGDWEFVE